MCLELLVFTNKHTIILILITSLFFNENHKKNNQLINSSIIINSYIRLLVINTFFKGVQLRVVKNSKEYQFLVCTR